MACSDDNGGDEGKDIQLAPGTPKDYTIFADETSGTPSEGISFTTAVRGAPRSPRPAPTYPKARRG